MTVYVGSAGQPQSSQSVASSQWTALPRLYQLDGGYVTTVYVTTVFADQTFYLSIQGSQMQVNAGASGEGIVQQINQLEPLPAQPAKTPSAPIMQPMLRCSQ